jgi:ATP-binding cassette subfamily B protein AbcA/BmrA
MICILSVALIYINFQLFIFVILLLPVLAILIAFINNKLKVLFAQWRESVRSFNKGTLRILEVLHLTKIQNAEEYEKEQMRINNEQFTSLDIKIQWLQEIYQAIRANWIWLMGILVIVLGGVAVINQNMSIADVFLFYIVFNFMKRDVGNILGAIPQFTNGKEALDRFVEMYLNETQHPYSGKENINTIKTIELSGVDFAYVPDKPVLSNIHLSLESGNIYMIKGKNGSGKTTLMHLILGFYRPENGIIKANNKRYDDLDIRQLRGHFGIVLQESPLFSGTIAENITYGHEKVTIQEKLEVST